MKSLKKFFLLALATVALTLTSCMSFQAEELAVLKQDSSMKMLGHFEKEVLLNSFTSSIWAPAHLKVSGDVILFNSPSVGLENTDEAISVALMDM